MDCRTFGSVLSLFGLNVETVVGIHERFVPFWLLGTCNLIWTLGLISNFGLRIPTDDWTLTLLFCHSFWFKVEAEVEVDERLAKRSFYKLKSWS